MFESIRLTGGKLTIKADLKIKPTFIFTHENAWVGELKLEVDHGYKKAYFITSDKTFEIVGDKRPPDRVQLNSAGVTFAELDSTMTLLGFDGQLITKLGHRFIVYVKGSLRTKCYVKSEVYDREILSITYPNLKLKRTLEIFPCDFIDHEELQAIIGIVSFRLISSLTI
jgi:hypothetical protein